MDEVPAAVVRAIAPEGRLRATINLGNSVLAQRDAVSGELGGVSVALARELAGRLGLELELLPFDGAGKAFDALRGGAADVGFLAIDPLRAAELAFTPPYVIIEGGYLVPAGSALRAVEEVDRPGVRIAAGRNSAYDLFLRRALKHAELVYGETSASAVALFRGAGLEAAAGVKQPLAAAAAADPALRLLPGRFMVIEQAMAQPAGRGAAAEAFLRGFVEEMKASGFVAVGLAASGQGEATVAQPAG